MATYTKDKLPDELKTYRIRQRVRAYELTESSTASTPFGALSGQPGDYLVVGEDGNVGIIPAAEFTRLFESDDDKSAYEDGYAQGIYSERTQDDSDAIVNPEDEDTP